MKKYPILILHGWNLHANRYANLKTELEKRRYEVICFDLPGFKNTTPLNTPYTIADYAKFVINNLKKRKLEEVVIIGHSFGGRIGIYLCLNFPDKISGLILSGAPGLGSDHTLKEKIYLLVAKIGKNIVSDRAKKLLYKLVGSDYYKTSGVLRETFKNIISFRLEPFLHKIRQPTLIIWGRDDKIVPISVAYEMHKLIKKSELVIISGARHSLPWTHPKEFADKVEEFVKNL